MSARDAFILRFGILYGQLYIASIIHHPEHQLRRKISVTLFSVLAPAGSVRALRRTLRRSWEGPPARP